jgi:SAM-dependent methyltransferase
MDELPATAFRRQDESPDEHFYRQPRFVTHIDVGAVAAVTQLYREVLPPGGAILDLMSSWISHLPPEVSYRRVVGLGLNRAELAENPRLSSFVVQNLNTEPRLPFADGEFGGAGIAVSVDYLIEPVAVLRDLGRVLEPGAPLVITFSNRCFPTKAVAIWHHLSGRGRLKQRATGRSSSCSTAARRGGGATRSTRWWLERQGQVVFQQIVCFSPDIC